MERNKIYHGDCFDFLPQIADKSIDLILTDMPYGTLNKSNPDAQWDKEVSLPTLWNQYKRIIKPNGAILLFGQGVFAAKLIMSNQKWFKYDIVWNKIRKSNFLNCKKMPMRHHEQILVFYDRPPTYNPQMVYVGKPNHSRGKQGKEQTNRNYGKIGKSETVMSDYRYPGTIITFPKQHGSDGWLHPTSKPVNLLRWLIRTYSNEGDLVLDTFAGSGSTLLAAIEEKRDWIGIEIDEKFFNIASKRIENEKIQPRLF